MTQQQTENLSTAERTLSALAGIALSLLTLRRGSPVVRTVSGAVGTALLARALAGHCGMKSALTGETSLGEGLADQWHRMSGKVSSAARGLSGSRARAAKSDAIDESVEESFPASDPPASRIPDVPPGNAESKWAAARAADGADGFL
jgi:uncharacterized membrane protein